MGRNNKDFHDARGVQELLNDSMGLANDFVSKYTPNAQKKKDALSEDVENATDSYQVEAAHNKHNPRPKGPHADEVDEARKKGPLTITTQYIDSQDDK